jgi:cysteine desulfurase
MVNLDHHYTPHTCGPALEQHKLFLEGSWRGSLEGRREPLFELTGARSDTQFSFTHSGAEAIAQIHWTVFCEVARKEGKTHFWVAPWEDAAMLQSLKRLEELGCFVKILPVDEAGRIDLPQLEAQLGPRAALVSLSWAHGLTGILQPVEEIAAIAKRKGALLHVDASYALGKAYTQMSDIGIDYLSLAGAPLHSVPASGAVLARAGAPLLPLLAGRPLDAASFLALSAAASQALLSRDSMSLEVARLRDLLIEKTPSAQPLWPQAERLPNVALLQFPGIHQEMLAYALQRKGISVAVGGEQAPRLHKVLQMCRLGEVPSQTALSFALSRFNTQADVERAAVALEECAVALRPLAQEVLE